MKDEKFKKLKAKWDKILEREGLPDIEKRGYLRVYHDQKLKAHVRGQNGLFQEEWDQPRLNSTFNPVKNAAKEAYFQLAGEFLHEHTFETERERKIWELHAQGMPVREIAKKLRQPRNWSQINKKIIVLRKLMLAKTSLP